MIKVNFYKHFGSQDTSGINKLKNDGNRIAVQIFATVKVFRNEKYIQDAKIVPISCSFVLYHRADVIHSWLYLTGKLQELKEKQLENNIEDAKTIAKSNNNSKKEINTPEKENQNI